MSEVKITINTDNEAFEYPCELPRILTEIAAKFESGISEFDIKDINGNIVGKVEVEE